MSSDYIDPDAGKAREAHAGRVGSEGVGGHPKTATARYKFSEDGGAIGAHELEADPLPIGAIIPAGGVTIDLITPLTSLDAATVELSLESAGDLYPASTAPWGGMVWGDVGAHPNGSADAIKTTAARKIVLTIADFALTAGEFVVYLEYEDTRT